MYRLKPTKERKFKVKTWTAKWLDHLTLVKRVLGSKLPSDLSPSVRRICQLPVIPEKKAKGITRCGHIKRKDQGYTARLVYLFSGLFVLSTETIPILQI